MKTYRNYTECTLNHVIQPKCMNNLGKIKSEINDVDCNCPQPCIFKSYEKQTSYAQFPSKYLANNFVKYFKSVADNIADGLSDADQGKFDGDLREHLKDNLLLLDIYYEEMSYMKNIEAKADTLSSLVSDLGGQLGLWLGCSILTIVEIIYCCFWAIPKGMVKQVKKKINE